jgi:curved DNA-binding protein CbpA
MSLSDYYKLLGLKPTATKAEVKKRYRSLAMKLHPDKNPDPLAHQVFVRITEAYEAITEGKIPKQRQRQERPKKENVVFRRGNEEFTKEEFEEKIRKAKEFAERKKILQEERFYQRFFSSKLFRYHPYIASAFIMLSVLLFLDYQYHIKEDTYKEFEIERGSSYYELYLSKSKAAIPEDLMMFSTSRVEKISVRRSFVFRIPKEVSFQFDYKMPSERKVVYEWVPVIRTVHDGFWFYFLIFSMPISSFFFHKRKGLADFFVKVNTTVPLFVLLIFCVQLFLSY